MIQPAPQAVFEKIPPQHTNSSLTKFLEDDTFSEINMKEQTGKLEIIVVVSAVQKNYH